MWDDVSRNFAAYIADHYHGCRGAHWGASESMYKDPLESVAAASSLPVPLQADPRPHAALSALLKRAGAKIDELPPLPDLIAGVVELCEGGRERVLLPLSGLAAEFALLRDGDDILVDCYGTENAPEVFLRQHRVSLPELCRGCVEAAREAAEAHESKAMREALEQLAARLASVRIAPVRRPTRKITCSGGVKHSPGPDVPLGFGFRAEIPRSRTPRAAGRDFADVHALLFEGELWGFAGENRVTLARGPILLATQRMAAAVRLLLQAWQAGREMNARLCSGGFSIGVRLRRGLASVEIVAEDGRRIFLERLAVPQVALPILRLCTDVLRTLVTVDRRQLRNLRVSSLRQELRMLRRILRTRERRDGFENPDPERLRMASPAPEPTPAPQTFTPVPGRLRYAERWQVEIEGLDANGVFLCGDRLLLATPKTLLGLCRGSGEVLWSLPSDRAQVLMVGQVLLTWHGDGELRLMDVQSGQVYARTHLPSRSAGVPVGLFGGGGELPPAALISDGCKSLWSVDLRTGELRFRYRGRGGAGMQVRRAGRVLLLASGDSSLDGLDIATGEVVWRHTADTRFCLAPQVVGQVAVAVSGELHGGAGGLYGIELFTGRRLWQTELPGAPSAPPVVAGQSVVVPCDTGDRGAQLVMIEPESGRVRFVCPDPGLSSGGCAVAADGRLIINSPHGAVHCIEMQGGGTRWMRILSNPLTDDIPRRLGPVLRRGVLFIPAAQVHVLRAADGVALTQSTGCDLVPDFLHVDERGCLYVAEESGHLRVYGATPLLTLVV